MARRTNDEEKRRGRELPQLELGAALELAGDVDDDRDGLTPLERIRVAASQGDQQYVPAF